MRQFIEYLESLRDDPQHGNIKPLLQDLILRCETAYSKELWDSVPIASSPTYTVPISTTDEVNYNKSQQNDDHMFNVNNGNTSF